MVVMAAVVMFLLFFLFVSVRQNGAYRLQLATAKFLELEQAECAATAAGAVAPMPGVVDKVIVMPGDSVKAGDPVAVIIAMKMEVWHLADGVADSLYWTRNFHTANFFPNFGGHMPPCSPRLLCLC